MNLINLTPHELNLNDGRAIPASGGIARVTSKFGGFDVNGICRVEYGQVEGLPEPQKKHGVYRFGIGIKCPCR